MPKACDIAPTFPPGSGWETASRRLTPQRGPFRNLLPKWLGAPPGAATQPVCGVVYQYESTGVKM
jgi:hypothetical protein